VAQRVHQGGQGKLAVALNQGNNVLANGAHLQMINPLFNQVVSFLNKLIDIHNPVLSWSLR
jgi:hypothetical protein